MKNLIIFTLLICAGYHLKSQNVISFDSTNLPFIDELHFLQTYDSTVFLVRGTKSYVEYKSNQWHEDSIMINSSHKAQIIKFINGQNKCFYALTDTAVFLRNGNTWMLEFYLPTVLQGKEMTVDKDTNFWFLPSNSANMHLYKYDKTNLTMIYLPSNYFHAGYLGVVDDSSNLFYLSPWMNAGYGIIKYDGSSFSLVDTLISTFWMDIDNQNRLWSAASDSTSQNGHILQYRDSAGVSQIPVSVTGYQTLISSPTLHNNNIHFVTIDTLNNYDIYFSDINGTHSFNLPSLLPISSANNYFETLRVDDLNNYWFFVSDSTGKRVLYCIKNTHLNKIKGTAFHDLNMNGTQDMGEMPLPNVVISLMPNSFSFYTNQNGEFEITLFDSSGSYQVSASLPYPWNQTTSPISYSLTQTYQGQIDSGSVFGFASPPNIQLALVGNANAFRVNSKGTYHLVVKNLSNTMLDSVQVRLLHDPILIYYNNFPQGNSYQGNTLSWILDSLKVLENRHIYSSFHVPINQVAGQPLFSRAILTFTNDFLNITDTVDIAHIIYGPLDPNNKVEFHRNNAECVNPGDTLNYTINFQNCGNDTCFKVVIKDTLSNLFDITSLNFQGFSHDFTYQLINGNELILTFDSINLLDSNTSYYESMGFVQYSIVVGNYNPTQDSVLLNRANIFFDYNAAVVTNFTQTELCNSIGLNEISSEVGIQIYPNPVEKYLKIQSTQSLINREYKILSIEGKLISSGTFKNTHQNEIELSELEKGMYIIEIENVIVRKFVR